MFLPGVKLFAIPAYWINSGLTCSISSGVCPVKPLTSNATNPFVNWASESPKYVILLSSSIVACTYTVDKHPYYIYVCMIIMLIITMFKNIIPGTLFWSILSDGSIALHLAAKNNNCW